jgi:integrase
MHVIPIKLRYIIIAINTGLRNGDILNLTYDKLQKEKYTFREGKTNKIKTIAINGNIRSLIPPKKTGDLFLTQKGTTITIQHLNRELKKIFMEESKELNISSHSLRKSFGRHVYLRNQKNGSETALLYLMDIFNHSSMTMVKKYLGIRQDELNDIYLNL